MIKTMNYQFQEKDNITAEPIKGMVWRPTHVKCILKLRWMDKYLE